MDNVTVQDGVTLQNTVVSPHAIVHVCVCGRRVGLNGCGCVGVHVLGRRLTCCVHTYSTHPTGILQSDGRVRRLIYDGAAQDEAEGRGADAGLIGCWRVWVCGDGKEEERRSEVLES